MTDKPKHNLLDGCAYFAAIKDAADHPGSGYGANAGTKFDAATGHITVLLEDAANCFFRGSFGTSVFLALTALEETAKAEVLLYRRSTNEVPAKKKREPLRDHAAKHLIAVRPTVFMGRLVDLLGVKRCEALKLEAETGGLNQLREVALYFEVRDGRMVTPGSTISFSRAREVLLLALEAADDILVGNTNRSFAYGKRFEDLIIKVLELKESGAINEADKSV